MEPEVFALINYDPCHPSDWAEAGPSGRGHDSVAFFAVVEVRCGMAFAGHHPWSVLVGRHLQTVAESEDLAVRRLPQVHRGSMDRYIAAAGCPHRECRRQIHW